MATNIAYLGNDRGDQRAKLGKMRQRGNRRLVHIQAAINFHLNHMALPRRAAIALRNERPGKWRVAGHPQTSRGEGCFDPVNNLAPGCRADFVLLQARSPEEALRLQDQAAVLDRISRPAAAGSSPASAAVEAWARCAVEKASLT